MLNGQEEHLYVNSNIIQKNIRERKQDSQAPIDRAVPSPRSVSEDVASVATSSDLGYDSQCEPSVPSARSSIDHSNNAQSMPPVNFNFKPVNNDEHATPVGSLTYQSCSSLKSPTPTPRSYLSLGSIENGETDRSTNQSSQGGKISSLVQKYEEECDDKTRYLTYKKNETFGKFLRRHLAHIQVTKLGNENGKDSLEQSQQHDIKISESTPIDSIDEQNAKKYCSFENIDETVPQSKEKSNNKNTDIIITNYILDDDIISSGAKSYNDEFSENEEVTKTNELNISSTDEEKDANNILPNATCLSQQSMLQTHVPTSFENLEKDRYVTENKYTIANGLQTMDSKVNNNNNNNNTIIEKDTILFQEKLCDSTQSVEKSIPDNFEHSDAEKLKKSPFLSLFQQNHSSLHSLEYLNSTGHNRSSSSSSLSSTKQRYIENENSTKSCCLARESSTSSVDYPKEIALDRRIPIFRKKVSKFLPPKIHQRTSSDSSIESYKPPDKVVTTFKELASENERSLSVLTTFKAIDTPPANNNAVSLIELYQKSEIEKPIDPNESCLNVFRPTESDSQCQEEAKSESEPSSQLSSDSFDKNCTSCVDCNVVDNMSQSEDDDGDTNACSYFLKESNHPVSILQGSELCRIESPSLIQLPDSRRSCETLKCRQFRQKRGLCPCAYYKPCNKHCYEKKINRRQRKNFQSFVEPQLFQVQHIVKTDIASKFHKKSNEKTFSTFKPKDEELGPPGEHIYMNVKIPQNEKFLLTMSAESDILSPRQQSVMEIELQDSENFETRKNSSRNKAESSDITQTFLRNFDNNVECVHCRNTQRGPVNDGSLQQPRLSCGTPKSSRKSYGCNYQPHKLTQLCVGELLKHDVSRNCIFLFTITMCSVSHCEFYSNNFYSNHCSPLICSEFESVDNPSDFHPCF